MDGEHKEYVQKTEWEWVLETRPMAEVAKDMRQQLRQLIAEQLVIAEGEAYPWWGRVWRRDYAGRVAHILPIPLCWLARLGRKLWLLSFRVRPTAWELQLQRASLAGFAEGLAKKTEIHREIADDLFERVQAIVEGIEAE